MLPDDKLSQGWNESLEDHSNTLPETSYGTRKCSTCAINSMNSNSPMSPTYSFTSACTVHNETQQHSGWEENCHLPMEGDLFLNPSPAWQRSTMASKDGLALKESPTTCHYPWPIPSRENPIVGQAAHRTTSWDSPLRGKELPVSCHVDEPLISLVLRLRTQNAAGGHILRYVGWFIQAMPVSSIIGGSLTAIGHCIKQPFLTIRTHH